MYSRSKKKRNTPLYFNTNYRTEMKLVLINIYYCLCQFDALKFVLQVRLHGESVPNFNFLNVKPQISQRNCKIQRSNCLDINFHNMPNIYLRVIRRRNYNYSEFLTRKFSLLSISGVKKKVLILSTPLMLKRKTFLLKTRINYKAYV